MRRKVTRELDEIDRGILYLLQKDARNLSPANMADSLPVSEGTVRNRLDRLEKENIIEKYIAIVNYEVAGYPLKITYSCHAPLLNRPELATRATEIAEVIRIQEMVTGTHNVRVTALAEDVNQVSTIAKQLSEIGLTVELENLVHRERMQPFTPFSKTVIEEG